MRTEAEIRTELQAMIKLLVQTDDYEERIDIICYTEGLRFALND